MIFLGFTGQIVALLIVILLGNGGNGMAGVRSTRS